MSVEVHTVILVLVASMKGVLVIYSFGNEFRTIFDDINSSKTSKMSRFMSFVSCHKMKLS